jgi:hypothetical protein
MAASSESNNSGRPVDDSLQKGEHVAGVVTEHSESGPESLLGVHHEDDPLVRVHFPITRGLAN